MMMTILNNITVIMQWRPMSIVRVIFNYEYTHKHTHANAQKEY